MDEIASQSQQLEVHLQVKRIEADKKKEHEIPAEALPKATAEDVEIDREDQLIIEKQSETRRQLIQDVLNEAKENGTTISPAVMKLISNCKCKNMLHFYL